MFTKHLIKCDVIDPKKYLAAHSAATVEFSNHISGMKFRDISIGDGKEIYRGDRVTIQLSGCLPTGKEVETTSHLPGRAITITAGGKEIISGVSEGVIGMREYGSRELLIPPHMHYSDRFPNTVLIYEVMVRRVNK